jgi:hypothetical protein
VIVGEGAAVVQSVYHKKIMLPEEGDITCCEGHKNGLSNAKKCATIASEENKCSRSHSLSTLTLALILAFGRVMDLIGHALDEKGNERNTKP